MSKTRESRAEAKVRDDEKPAGEIPTVLQDIEDAIKTLVIRIDGLQTTLSPILKSEEKEINLGPEMERGSILGIRLQRILMSVLLANESISNLSNGTAL